MKYLSRITDYGTFNLAVVFSGAIQPKKLRYLLTFNKILPVPRN